MRTVLASLLMSFVVACVAAAAGASVGHQVGASEERKIWSARLFGLQAEQVARLGKTDREWVKAHPEAVSQ